MLRLQGDFVDNVFSFSLGNLSWCGRGLLTTSYTCLMMSATLLVVAISLTLKHLNGTECIVPPSQGTIQF